MEMNKLKAIAKPRSQKALERAKYRKDNKDWILISNKIAIILHDYLRKEGIKQNTFADRMGFSTAYASKLLKGGENLTLETICKLQKIIGKDIISVIEPQQKLTVVVQHPASKLFNEDVKSNTVFRTREESDSMFVVAKRKILG